MIGIFIRNRSERNVHASRDIRLTSGVNTGHTAATSSSKSASIGVEASVGM
ncbi:hypothetical protein [Acetobacter orientalis]|uniref:hypothetical protein n=1 Tax=Acetobacter orientalis TaxID=146474 RepID=UPI0039E98D4F